MHVLSAMATEEYATRGPLDCKVCLQPPPTLLPHMLFVEVEETSLPVLDDLALYKLEGIIDVVSTNDI